ncbi:hypothetical protein MTO96_029158 [Rhipicephalus appendiculatus]
MCQKICSLSEGGSLVFGWRSRKRTEDPADNCSGSDMSSIGGTGGQKRSGVNETSSSTESKRQQIEASDDDSSVMGNTTVANMEDLDEGCFKVVRHRKDRTLGIRVLLTAIQDACNRRHVNPITLFSDIESMLGAAPIRSRFTAQGALLLNVGQKNMPTYTSIERPFAMYLSVRESRTPT